MSKYCQHCGAEVQDNSVFCEHCGKNLSDAVVEKREPQRGEKRCKTCGEIHDKKLKFCPNCGVNSRQLIAAKLTNCKRCGHFIAANAVKCPSCGRRTHYNFKMSIIGLGIFLFFVIIVSLGGESNTPSNTDNSVINEVENNKQQNEEQQSTILYSDDFFDIEYMELYDVDYVNTSYLQLKVTNKSSQKVMLLLDDVYVNDITVESGTALPIELEPGKISTTPFILFSGNTGLTADDITKVEFNLVARDDNFDVVHTTNKIIITK